MSSFGLFLILCAGLLLMVALIRFLSWLTELQEWHGSVPRAALHAAQRYVAVKHYQEAEPDVMSRSDTNTLPSRPSSLQTDDAQTDRQPAHAAPGRAELLTLYTAMRAAGMGREKARPALKAVGLPLDNNLWAEAAPDADEPPYTTPYAGRPTSAQFFETDAELAYQPPH